MRDFATLARVKTRLRITGTDDDDDLKGIMQSASYALVRHCGREPRLDDYDETYDGTGLARMVLRQYPLVEVSKIFIDDVELADGTFRFNKQILVRNTGVFRAGISNVRVLYSAGEDPSPADLTEAYLNIVKAFWMNRVENPNAVASQIIGVSDDQWGPDGPGAVPANAKGMLARFVNPVSF